jgi:hypothetical protein
MKEIVRRIDLWGLNMVFVIGGNGGNAAANAIQEECEAQGVVCAVAAVPKSIDNDILLVGALSLLLPLTWLLPLPPPLPSLLLLLPWGAQHCSMSRQVCNQHIQWIDLLGVQWPVGGNL